MSNPTNVGGTPFFPSHNGPVHNGATGKNANNERAVVVGGDVVKTTR
jgi:hypothetical protein